MKISYLKLLKYVAISALVLMLSAACSTGDQGLEGNLMFKTTSGTYGGQILPVAKGRSVSYEITDRPKINRQAKGQDVENAESSDPSVFDVTQINESFVTIEGFNEGTAMLTVTTTEGVRDRIEIEVRTPTTAYYSIDKINEEPVQAGIFDVAEKYNLSPQDEILFERDIVVDNNGDRLSGGNLSEFGEGTDGDTSVAARAITAGVVGEKVSVANVYGGEFIVRVVDDYAPTSLVGYLHNYSLGELDTSLVSVQSGKTFALGDRLYSLMVYPKDADGYAYLGTTDLNAGVKLSTPGVVELTYIGREDSEAGCVDSTDDDKCIEWGRLKDLAFTVTVKDEDATSVNLEITTGGLTETITLNL